MTISRLIYRQVVGITTCDFLQVESKVKFDPCVDPCVHVFHCFPIVLAYICAGVPTDPGVLISSGRFCTFYIIIYTMRHTEHSVLLVPEDFTGKIYPPLAMAESWKSSRIIHLPPQYFCAEFRKVFPSIRRCTSLTQTEKLSFSLYDLSREYTNRVGL